MLVIVSYDIRNDGRRTRVHKLLKNFGTRTQYSVFECDLTDPQLTRLQHGLERLIEPDEGDSVRFYHLCKACERHVERIGGILPPGDGPLFVS